MIRDMNTDKTTQSIAKAHDALKARGFDPILVSTKTDAFEKIKELIPPGASVMNGASETLREIGFVDYLKGGEHPWKNNHDAILAESDPARQGQLRREAVLSDYYAGSVHALTEDGELIIASNSGSQLPHLAYTSPNLVIVVGANKIVPTLADGFARIEQHVVPLEDERMKQALGFGTLWAKTLVLNRENPAIGRKVHVIIVNESLGF